MEKRGETSKKVSQVVHPFQLSVTAPSPSPSSTSPEEIPPLPQGKTIFDVRLNFSVDKVFELCYTDSEFYRGWMFVSLKSEMMFFTFQYFNVPGSQKTRGTKTTKRWRMANGCGDGIEGEGN